MFAAIHESTSTGKIKKYALKFDYVTSSLDSRFRNPCTKDELFLGSQYTFDAFISCEKDG